MCKAFIKRRTCERKWRGNWARLREPSDHNTSVTRGEEENERLGGSVLDFWAVTDRFGKAVRVFSSPHWPSEAFPLS